MWRARQRITGEIKRRWRLARNLVHRWQTSIISEDEGNRYASLGYYWHQVLQVGRELCVRTGSAAPRACVLLRRVQCAEPLCAVTRIWRAISVCDAHCGCADLFYGRRIGSGNFHDLHLVDRDVWSPGDCRSVARRKNSGTRGWSWSDARTGGVGTFDFASRFDAAVRRRLDHAAGCVLGPRRDGAGGESTAACTFASGAIDGGLSTEA